MKHITLTLILLLTIYAPAELTRIIIRDMFPVYPVGQFVFEIVFMWIAWLSAMIMVKIKWYKGER